MNDMNPPLAVKRKVFCAALVLLFLVLSVCSATPENDVVGVTNEGYYIRSGSQIFFSKNLQEEKVPIFDVEDKKYTCSSTENYFVLFTVDEKEDGKAFYFKGTEKKKLDLYPGCLKYKIPQIQSVGGDKIAVVTHEKRENILSYTMWIAEAQVFHLETDTYFPILRQQYAENEKGVTGRVITACGGSEDTLYIVRSKIPKTETDSQEAEILKYRIRVDAKEILNMEKMHAPYFITYITGNEKYALIDANNPFKPLNPSGKLVNTQERSWKEVREIPEIRSGNDIIEALSTKGKMLFRVPQGMYSLDLGTLEVSDLKESNPEFGTLNCLNELEILRKERR